MFFLLGSFWLLFCRVLAPFGHPCGSPHYLFGFRWVPFRSVLALLAPFLLLLRPFLLTLGFIFTHFGSQYSHFWLRIVGVFLAVPLYVVPKGRAQLSLMRLNASYCLTE